MKKILIFVLLAFSCTPYFQAGYVEQNEIFHETMLVRGIREGNKIKIKCSLTNQMYIELLTDSLFIYTKKGGLQHYTIE